MNSPRRRGKKGRCSQVFHTTDSRPNKEILDKSREVFAVRRSCLHYSREYVRLSRSSFLFPPRCVHPFRPPALLESLCGRRTFGILLLRIRRSYVRWLVEGMQNILAGLETVYALCNVGINGNSRNLICDNFREKQRIEKLNSLNPLR